MALPPISIDVTADTAQAEASLARVGQTAQSAGRQVQGGAGVMTASTASATKGFSVLGGQSRMLTQQLSQVAQQATATGQVGQALAVQAADIGLAFGTIGTIAGALIGITLPSLIQLFNQTGDEAKELADRVEEATQRISDLRMEARQLRLGVSPEELALMDQLSNAMSEIRDIEGQIEAATGRTRRAAELRLQTAIANKDAISAQLDELRELQTEVELLKDGSVSILANFDAMIPAAQSFADRLGEAAANAYEVVKAQSLANLAAAQSQQGRGGAGPGGPMSAADRFIASTGGIFVPGETDQPGGGGGGSGGGGGVDTFGADLEALQERLMTETELAQSAYEDRLQMLRDARERELLTNEEYNDLEQRLKAEHAEKMVDIDAWRYGNSLDKTEAFFGQSARALMSGNEKMVEIGRKFAAIEATINAGRAFAQVAADPSLPWFAKIPAAIGVASAISQFANQSGIGGGGGGAAATPQAETSAPQTQNFVVDLVGGNSQQIDGIQLLADQINEASRQGLLTNVMIRGT